MELAQDPIAIACMQDIIQHEHALVESIPDHEKAALMPIIRFVRSTLQEPCCCAGLLRHGSAVDAPPRLLDAAWMQMHVSSCAERDCQSRIQLDLAQSGWRNAFSEQGRSDEALRINGNRSSAWHLASPLCRTMSSTPEALYNQVNYHGTVQRPEARALNASHHLGRADPMHPHDGGLLLTTCLCKPKCLPTFRRTSEGNITDKCSSLAMDSFNLDELRRRLQPPAHDTDSDESDIQSIEANNADVDALDTVDNEVCDEEVGNNDSDSSNPSGDEEDYSSDIEWPMRWANGMLYSQTMSSDERLQFPKVHCRRRHIVKKEIGWIKKRTAMSVVSRVRHKRMCNLPCCTDCEMGTKRRKASKFGSRKCARLSTMNKIMSSLTATNSEETMKNNRESSKTEAACPRPARFDGFGKNELSHLTPELDTSLLATALITVFKNSKGHGLTCSEALQALTEGFMEEIGEYEGQKLASLVKEVLKKCPHFKELKNHRFILRSTPKLENTNLQSQGTLEDITDSDGRESQREVSLAKMLSERRETSLPQPANQSSIRNLCRRPAGGGLQCQSTTNVKTNGSLRDKYHQQLPIPAVATTGCYSAEMVDSYDDTCLDRKVQDKEEDMFSTVVDSCSGQSAEEQVQDQTHSGRCCRTDGKNWRCSNQVQKGSPYCERHQSRCKKGMAKQCLNAPLDAKESKQLQRKEATRQQNQPISQFSKSAMQLRPRRHGACVRPL